MAPVVSLPIPARPGSEAAPGIGSRIRDAPERIAPLIRRVRDARPGRPATRCAAKKTAPPTLEASSFEGHGNLVGPHETTPGSSIPTVKAPSTDSSAARPSGGVRAFPPQRSSGTTVSSR